ncbi:MAG: phosphatase PAP2 family protein [Candidatus Cloacimonetes bacterium]|nr:phosphatase PAP2 family protein [Candidatus Cloacimonadota bacterium]
MKKPIIGFILIALLTATQMSARVFYINDNKAYTNIALGIALDLANSYYNSKNVNSLTEDQIIKSGSSDVPFFDRWAINNDNQQLTDGSSYLTLISLGSTILYNAWDDPYTWDNLLVLSEILVVQNALNGWSKSLTLRKRPYVYDEDTVLETKLDKDARFSFYSNHTSFAFALAVYSHYYQHHTLKNPYVVTGSYALATIVGASRVAAGQHFPSDVIVGMVAGSVSSYLICRSHRVSRRTDIYLGVNYLQFTINF